MWKVEPSVSGRIRHSLVQECERERYNGHEAMRLHLFYRAHSCCCQNTMRFRDYKDMVRLVLIVAVPLGPIATECGKLLQRTRRPAITTMLTALASVGA